MTIIERYLKWILGGTLVTGVGLAATNAVEPEALDNLAAIAGKIVGNLVPIFQWILDNINSILILIRGILGV